MIDLRITIEEMFELLDPKQRYFQCICLGELSYRSTLSGSLLCLILVISPRYRQN